MLGIDPKTLRKHYRDELDLGATKSTAKVAEFLFRKATTEGHQCVTAAIFWMKTRGGWRAAPQTHEIAVKPASEMSDAELEARIREMKPGHQAAARTQAGGQDRSPHWGFQR